MYLKRKDLLTTIYNMDETGMPLEPHPPKVGAEESLIPNIRAKAAINCNWLIGCGSQAGYTSIHYICC